MILRFKLIFKFYRFCPKIEINSIFLDFIKFDDNLTFILTQKLKCYPFLLRNNLKLNEWELRKLN